jgi:transcriptional regulator with XRE-family HTH domain
MPGSAPTVQRRRVAAELRRLRTESGYTADAVGELLGWSKAKVSRYELARSGLKPSDVESLLDLYGVRGERREQLLALAKEATQRGWWEAYSDVLPEEYLAYIGLEAEATSTLQWQINVIPGLLQTERYAREIIVGYREIAKTAPVVVERRLQARMLRQDVLTGNPPLELTAIIDESVLQRQRGDRAVMHEQLEHIAATAEMPNVTLRVLPLIGPKKLALDSFQIFQFGKAYETQLHDVVSTESLRGQLYVEGETATYDFRLAFESLAAESLDPEESRQLVLRTAQLWKLSAGPQVFQFISARNAAGPNLEEQDGKGPTPWRQPRYGGYSTFFL